MDIKDANGMSRENRVFRTIPLGWVKFRDSRTRHQESQCSSVLESVLHSSPSTTRVLGVLHGEFWDVKTIRVLVAFEFRI
jgi:hypothetical protein